MEVTVPYREAYGQLFHKKGNKLVHAAPVLDSSTLKRGTDLKAVLDGRISITPINLELVSHGEFKRFKVEMEKSWNRATHVLG
jgi:broad specificity polyphosphatase/5'/3'-nucleotidase SurE